MYNQVAQFYSLSYQILGPNFISPHGTVNLAKYRLVDMFTKCSEPHL